MNQHKNALAILMLCTIVAAAALVSVANAQTTTASLTATSTSNAANVKLSGSGFDASENVTLKMLNETSNTVIYTFTENVTTDASGAFTATVSLPSGYYGTYNITAQTTSKIGFDEYTIDDAASVTSSPDDSNIITVVGSGFNAKENVTLTLNDTSAAVYTFPNVITANADGTFNATIIVPTSLNGNFTLIAATSTATANTAINVPDLSGPQGEIGATGAKGANGAVGADGEPGTPADTTILYFALVLSVAAVVVAIVSLVKKH